MMLSHRLWVALRQPSLRHPLLHRVLMRSQRRQISAWRRNIMWWLAAPGLLLLSCSPLLSTLVLGLLFFVLISKIYGLMWTLSIAGTLAQERENRTYDLICLTPEGTFGLNWAVCAGSLRRDKRLKTISSLVRGLAVIALILAGFVGLMLLNSMVRLSDLNQASFGRGHLLFVHALVIVICLCFDHIYSVALACVVGMLAPTLVNGRLEAQLGAAGLYVALQVGLYLVSLAAALSALPSLFQASGWIGNLGLAAAQVLIFAALREALLEVLWRWLTARLSVKPVELMGVDLRRPDLW